VRTAKNTFFVSHLFLSTQQPTTFDENIKLFGFDSAKTITTTKDNKIKEDDGRRVFINLSFSTSMYIVLLDEE